MTRRYVPILDKRIPRTALGMACAVASPYLAALMLQDELPGMLLITSMLVFAWLPAVLLTDKYVHKYPQRYITYLLASHTKAAAVMAVAFVVIRLVLGSQAAPLPLLFLSLLIFSVTDLLLSLPRRQQRDTGTDTAGPLPGAAIAATEEAASAQALPDIKAVNTTAIQADIAGKVDDSLSGFLQEHLPRSEAGIDSWLVISDRPENDESNEEDGDVGVLVGDLPLNNVARLNLYLGYCARRLAMGGYCVVRYTPLEVTTQRLRDRFSGIRLRIALFSHFIWYRAIPKIPWLDRLYFSPLFSWIDRFFLRHSKLRTRVLAMAEVWGRLAYYGMEVLAESGGEERYVLARRVTSPISGRRPSYYAVVALEKVGLDGKSIYLHKVRSMYPFSEFLQKRIFESHGLSEIGKFKDDPRLTDYGPLLRKHWIDELPGLYDWLRGDVKLVGMRATSPHFLSLYPKELYDLYIQTKPGLVPPIFDESTDGFDDIVKIEMTYLERYQKAPVRTDLQYFWYTFRDIVFRKVRSR